MNQSEALRQRALKVLPSGTTRSAVWYDPYPMYVARGEGSWITDVDGNRYLDLTNNLGVLIHGHAHPAIVEAVQKQAADGSCFALPTESEIALAELLTERVANFERVRFINTGSEAVALAIKAARAYTGKTKLIKLEGVYHGTYDFAEISNYSTPDNWGNSPTPVTTVPATPPAVTDSVLVTQANDVEMLKQRLDESDDIAAVLVDPVPPRCGMVPLAPEYIAALRNETRARGILLIYDEVIALRFGYAGAQGRYGGDPDLTALGKIIGGGYPVGAVAGRADVMEATASAVSSSGTFTANPVTMAAGLAGMRALTQAAYDQLDTQGERIREACTGLIAKHGADMQVCGTGSMMSIYFHQRPVADYRSYYKTGPEVAATSSFHTKMLRAGVLIAPTATCFFSTAVNTEGEEVFLAAFEQAVIDLSPKQMRVAAASLIFVLLAIGAGYLGLRASEPSLEPVTKVAVDAPTQIYFDHRSRPYVQAESWEDAFFAQGWLHARDRLWQMDMFRRAGKGRLAELLGADLLATDVSIWRAGVPELAARLARVAGPTLNRYVNRYVAGVNAHLDDMSWRPPEYVLLGVQPQPWTRQDVFALAALMAYQSANNLDHELLRMALVDALGKEDAAIFFAADAVLPDPIGRSLRDWTITLTESGLANANANPRLHAPQLGSNAWAVAPNKTDTPHAIFAFDSHDSFSLPNLTYDIHLFVGAQQIRGTSVAGLLGVINGYNEFLAWGFTNIGDSQDVFIETRDPVDPMRFLGREGWYSASTTTVSIPVAGGAPHELTLITTENGRLISDTPALSARWAPLEAHEFGLDALLALNRATSYADFTSAMDEFSAPSATATYADITGRVAQRTIGLLPKRGAGTGLAPLSASDSAAAWQGMIDIGDMPRIESPPSGFVHAANRPFHAGAPLISADNAPGYRVRRIAEYLDSRERINLDEVKALQTDVVNLQAKRLLPGMLEALSPAMRASPAATLLAEWQPQPTDDANAAAPLLFAEWYQQFVTHVFAQSLGPDLFDRLLGSSYLLNEAVDNHLLANRQGNWPVGEALAISFEAAVAGLSATHGSEPSAWQWGAAHQLHLKHEMSGAFPGSQLLFDRGPYPAKGGNATVGRARYSYKRPFLVSGGATVRMVLEMSNPIEAWMISPGGQSGHPTSDHYNDQTESWLTGAYDKVASSPEELGKPAITLSSSGE